VKENEKKIKVQEQQIIQSFDNISHNIAYKLGFNYVPWFTLTKIVLGIYSVLTCLVLFFRTDFLNLTVCTSAIYMILNTDRIKKWTFRTLVLGIFLSLGYDLFWFLMIQDFNSDQSDGGVEKSIKSFSLTVSYLSFFFRVILSFSNTYRSLLLLSSGRIPLTSTESSSSNVIRLSQEEGPLLLVLQIEKEQQYPKRQLMRLSHNTRTNRWAVETSRSLEVVMPTEVLFQRATKEEQADKEASKLDLVVAKMLLIWEEDDFSYL
jgi:hypothetical protein